jgi:hypothetical protein
MSSRAASRVTRELHISVSRRHELPTRCVGARPRMTRLVLSVVLCPSVSDIRGVNAVREQSVMPQDSSKGGKDQGFRLPP